MKPNKDRVQVTLHPVLRQKGTEVGARRGQSFSEYLEKLIEEDLRNPRPSVFDPPGIAISAVAAAEADEQVLRTERKRKLRA